MADDLNQNKQIAIFRGKTVRKIIYKKERSFPILDEIQILTDISYLKIYWDKMKIRDKEMSRAFSFWEQIKLVFTDGEK